MDKKLKIILDKKKKIAIVVIVLAIVICALVIFVLPPAKELMTGIDCISSPINELVVSIQKAMSGINTMSDKICIYSGENLPSSTFTEKVANLNSVAFTCKSGDAVCNKLEATTERIVAISDVKFKCLVSCAKAGDAYDCTIELQSP